MSDKIRLNKVQTVAYSQLRADAEYFCSLIMQTRDSPQVSANAYIMLMPFIGVFTDGAEQWSRKVGLPAPQYGIDEKEYYTAVRSAHKLFEGNFADFSSAIWNYYLASDMHFKEIRSLRERIFGYSNVGVGKSNEHFCGNTVFCAAFLPNFGFSNVKNYGEYTYKMSVFAGKMVGAYLPNERTMLKLNPNAAYIDNDYHFFLRCPLKRCEQQDLALFTILCLINFILYFTDRIFLVNRTTMTRIAYLVYYYVAMLIQEINELCGTAFHINDALISTDFRNCMAHYGLGSVLAEKDIIEDGFGGLTQKVFGLSFSDMANQLRSYIASVSWQLERYLLKS